VMQRVIRSKLLRIAGLSFFLVCSVSGGRGAAAQADLQIHIKSIECTVDETYDSPDPYYIVTPEQCANPPIASGLPDSVNADSLPASPNTPRNSQAVDAAADSTRRPGKQAVLENSVFEPLAFWAGIGSSETPAARPVLLVVSFLSASLLLVDIAVFDARLCRPAANFARSKIGRLHKGKH
jgi:hypothetical protein